MVVLGGRVFLMSEVPLYRWKILPKLFWQGEASQAAGEGEGKG